MKIIEHYIAICSPLLHTVSLIVIIFGANDDDILFFKTAKEDVGWKLMMWTSRMMC